MSLLYRKKRINKICKHWNLKKNHDLMASHKLDKKIFSNFKLKIKLYISRALNINYENDDKAFIKKVNSARSNRLNVTPNGAVVPKKEFQLEYNMILRDWCDIIKNLIKNKPGLITRFRTTPNIRIKYGKELNDNLGRGLSTSLPHSDAWVEGPWGMNCFFPLFGDSENNNLVYYEPKTFNEKMISTAATYTEMQWVMKYYRKIKIKPQIGSIYFSDYALVHNTFRNKNAGTRISIDTTIFVGDHKPHKDREKEYRKTIPELGFNEIIGVRNSETNKFSEKTSVFSHYTANSLKTIKII